jgi:hypothetical protein
MVKAMIDISEDTNAILNIVKAKYRLHDKSQAIDKMAEEYENYLLEIRPKFVEEIRKIEQEPYEEYSSVEELFDILRNKLGKTEKNRAQARHKKSKTSPKKNARSHVLAK